MSPARKRNVTTEELQQWIAVASRAADDKKATDIVVLEVGAVLGICDWFVIASGSNTRQVKSIVDGIEEWVDGIEGPKPLRVEGLDTLEWVLMDYGDFVIHVFKEETRHFYDLERLWADVPRLAWTEIESPTTGRGRIGS